MRVENCATLIPSRCNDLLSEVSEVKKFLLKRYMRYTETLELEAESWDEAKKAFENGTEFDRIFDDTAYDESMEFLGDIEST